MIMIWLLSTSCSYEDLGLKEVEAEDITESHSLDDISNEDFFYRLKNQQRTQNPFNDLHIRKAILHAVDRERIVEEILGPYGSVLNSLFCSDSPYYYPAWAQYDYDLDLAQEYLQRAGYGPQNPLYVTIGFTERSQAREKIAKIIREDLSQIGIEIWLEDHNSKDWYSSVLKSGDYEMGIWALYNFDGLDLEHYFASYKIPPMETSENRRCSNYYWYRNDDIDQMVQDVSYTEDVHLRQTLYTDFQQILADDAVIMPLYSRLYTIAHNHQIENISVNPENGCMLAGLDQWTVDFDQEDIGVTLQVSRNLWTCCIRPVVLIFVVVLVLAAMVYLYFYMLKREFAQYVITGSGVKQLPLSDCKKFLSNRIIIGKDVFKDTIDTEVLTIRGDFFTIISNKPLKLEWHNTDRIEPKNVLDYSELSSLRLAFDKKYSFEINPKEH